MTHLLLTPRALPLAMRIDRAPALLWLGLHTAALWPTWRWMVARVADGSDEPLGLLALAVLAALLWSVRRDLRSAPRLPWLALAVLGTVGATALRSAASPLVAALLAIAAWACGLLAFLPDARRGAMRVAGGVLWPAPRHGIGTLPVLGLAVLALPLIASLQFYAGYPLRVVTAEASRWLLSPWFHVLREGSSLNVDGLLVIVDAPCSGVQMAWAGYFAACAVALWRGLGNRAFALRLPAVSALVLGGNIVRNTLLVGLEGAGRQPGAAVHQAVGLLLLAGVCGGIAWVMARPVGTLENS
ncbi:exosortase Q [Ottowia testudinis]|uniref:Exosortase Q n=1 Tax=Ottowia testudinis TaxID=2816950 RepID=A0A975CL46_9BURK|nr:exosortase Q [Ottowia testudinis]QTD45478.1 exosortase Q [Ottowia testudinis]